MIRIIIIAIIIFVAIGTIMSFLHYASLKMPQEDGKGGKILKMPPFYYLFGIGLLVSGIGLLIYLFFFENQIDRFYGIIFSLIAIIPGLALFAKGYIFHIIMNEDGIKEMTMWGKQKEILWNEITSFSYANESEVAKELKIKSNKQTITVHSHIVGFPYLVEQLENLKSISSSNKKNKKCTHCEQENDRIAKYCCVCGYALS